MKSTRGNRRPPVRVPTTRRRPAMRISPAARRKKRRGGRRSFGSKADVRPRTSDLRGLTSALERNDLLQPRLFLLLAAGEIRIAGRRRVVGTRTGGRRLPPV